MEWNNKQEIVRETLWTSGPWHMTVGPGEFFISHMDILLAPCGRGKTEKEAFAKMLNEIDEYEKKMEKVRSEIHEHLKTLEEGAIEE